MDTEAHGIPTPESETLSKWPIKIPRNLKGAREAINASKFLRIHSDDDTIPCLAEIRRNDTTVTLQTAQGVEIASLETDFGNPTARALEGIVKQAETLGRSQRLLELDKVHEGDSLRHGLRVEVGRLVGGEWRMVDGDKLGEVAEGDTVSLVARNRGDRVVFVLGLCLNVAGDITALDGEGGLGGHKLSPGESFAFGSGIGGDGLEVVWPPSVPRTKPVGGRFIFIITNSPVHLSYDTTSNPLLEVAGKTPPKPESPATCFATGTSTEVRTSSGYTQTPYNTIEVPFSISPHQTQDIALPLWSSENECGTGPVDHTPELVSKGTIGGILRALRHVPSFVRVVNEHTEEILVVVTKYHPNRLMTSGGLCVSNTGLSLNYDTTTFETPATKKILAPNTDRERCMGIFPLWTRREEFALISIFTGTERKPFIENDRVPTGATVYFRNNPNLTIVKHGEQEEESGSSSDAESTRRVAKT